MAGQPSSHLQALANLGMDGASPENTFLAQETDISLMADHPIESQNKNAWPVWHMFLALANQQAWYHLQSTLSSCWQAA